jgi:hypothetical protein
VMPVRSLLASAEEEDMRGLGRRHEEFISLH